MCVAHSEFSGLHVTPNAYTTLDQVETFTDKMRWRSGTRSAEAHQTAQYDCSLHIRCGTDIVADLRAGGAPGEILVWQDPLCQGPTPRSDWQSGTTPARRSSRGHTTSMSARREQNS